MQNTNIKLPNKINPKKEAQRRSDYVGFYSKKNFKRIYEVVNNIEQDAIVNFSLKIDEQNLVVIHGHAIISVNVRCERCLSAFIKQLDCSFVYSIVTNMEDVLPSDYEPIEVDQFGEIDLLKIVEDELLISLPLVCKHDIEHCEVSEEQQTYGNIPIMETIEKPNPFAVLKNLKK